MRSYRFVLALAAMLLACLNGCGPANSLSGSVNYDGKPVANGTITFTPKDGKGPVAGAPISDGHYDVKDITPGPKIAQIAGVNKVNFAKTQEEAAAAAKDAAQHGDSSGIIERADSIPPGAVGNGAVVEVKPGKTELNFDLMPPAAGGKK